MSDTSPSLSDRLRTPEMRFFATFLFLLAGGFTLLSLQAVNDSFVEPFTAGVAVASGHALDLIGEDISKDGTILRNERFAVNIRNGCNGLETMIIFLAAVVAFPSPWKSRLLGLGLGLIAIQGINLIRVVALFLTGAYFPAFFDSSHTVVWQMIVVSFAVILFLFWVSAFTAPDGRSGAPESAG